MTSNKGKQKKKVLYFIPEFPRLTETFIEREVSKLIELGNLDVAVLSLSKASGEMSSAVSAITSYERLTFKDIFLAIFTYILRHPLRVVKAHSLIFGHDQVPYLIPKKATGVNKITDNLSVVKSFQRTRMVQFLKGLAYTKVVERYSPDHIHCHFLSEPSTIIMVVATMMNIPYSVSAHAKDVWVDGTLIKSKTNSAKFIAVCNKNTCERVKELSGENFKDKVHLLFHGVDSSKLFSNVQNVQRIPQYIFCLCSRYVEKKGLKYLVDASKILRDEGLAFEVHIVGAKDPYSSTFDDIVTQIQTLDLGKHVILEGNGVGIPNSKVVEFYKKASIFVLPSVTSGEGDIDGVPTVIIEAALAKLPIVTTQAGSIGDLINSDTGILVAQRDAHSLANGLEELLIHEDKGNKLAQNAYNKAIEMFNLDTNIKKLEHLLLSE